MKNNRGYSLVEMLIVIAIMAILSGLATMSISLIRRAKAQDALSTFNSQLSSAWLQTKSIGNSEKSMYFTIEPDADPASDDYVLSLYDTDSSGSDVLKSTTTLKSWGKYVTITYTSSDAAQVETGYGTGKWYIKFNKATGAVVKGAGDYTFTGKNGIAVGTVHLDAVTGNHYVK